MAFFTLRTLIGAAVVGLLAAVGLAAAAPLAPSKTAAVLTTSQFFRSVMQEVLPAHAFNQLDVQVQKAAFELNNEAFRSLPNGKNRAKLYREAPAAFQSWLDQTLLQARKVLLTHEGEDYRLAAREVDMLKIAVDRLAKLKFSEAQVEFVAKFLSTYFTNKTNSVKPRDILNAFKQALLDSGKNITQLEAAQYRNSDITAEVGKATDAVAAEAGKIAAAAEAVVAGGKPADGGAAAPTSLLQTIEADAEEALVESYGLFSWIMNTLDYINKIPQPILLLVGVAIPPLGTLLSAVQAATCFWDSRAAWSFTSWELWSPVMLCGASLVNLLPVGPAAGMALTFLFDLAGFGLSYAAPPEGQTAPSALDVLENIAENVLF